MSMPIKFPNWLLDFMDTVDGADTEQQKARLKAIAELRGQKAIYEAEMAHELELLKIKFAEEINRAEEREARITVDYKEFLDKIDEMKGQITETFPDMPKAFALLIHQHAKGLIDSMWRNSDMRSQSLGRKKLARFSSVVLDDTTQVLMNEDSPKIPIKTLKLIQK